MTLPDARTDPNAPTPDEHERRIADLRARRKRRLRVLAMRASLGAGLVTLALAAFVYWLLTTIGGRNLLLAQIEARLPANASLEWREAEGPASGPLTLRGVRFTFDGTVFTARRVTLDPALAPLIGRRLRLDALQVEGATLDLAPSDEPFELPHWPEVLPQIAPPLALQADDIRIDGLVVTREQMPLVDIRTLRGGLDVSDGRLHAERLVLDSDRGRIAVHGDYVPVENYRTDLVATALVPARDARTPLRLGFVARGDLDRLDVGIAGAAPGPVRASLVLRGATPRWQLHASADGVDTAAFSGPNAPESPLLSLQLQANGTGGRADLRGRVTKGDFALAIRPSVLRLDNDVLEFAPLSLHVFDGDVLVRGQGDFNDTRNARLHYSVSARGLRWGAPGDAEVRADADLGIAGTQAAWAVTGRAGLARGGERAQLRLDGRGREQTLTIRSLHARMPSGTLDARGEIAWRPQWRWQLDATLAGFDPGYFAPGWNGAVRGGLASEGRVRAGGSLAAAFALRGLGGQLRGRALSGRADVRAQGADYRGDLALGIGRSHIDARGTFGFAPRMHWDLDASLAAFDPGFFIDGWPGAVDARIRTRGRMRAAPGTGIDASIDVPRIAGSLRGRPLSGRGTVAVASDTYRGDITLHAGASDVRARGTIGRTLDLDARFAPLQPGDLWPGARGNVRGTLRVTGPRSAPSITADLRGQDLAIGDYRATTLLAQGRLPWQAGATPGALTVRASGLQLGLPLESLDVDARGAFTALELDARARGDAGALALAGRVAKRGATWQGALASLQLDPARGTAWRLQQPAAFRWDGRNGALGDACLASSGGGTLCASADWPRRELEVEGRGLPLALLLPYLPERDDGRRWQLLGEVALDASLRPAGNAWRGEATLTSAAGGLKFDAGAREELLRYDALSLRATFDPQRIELQLASDVFDDGRVTARIAAGWDGHAPLAGEIDVATDELTWLELFSPDIVDPRGRLDGRIALAGTRAQPRLGGQARLTAFTTELPALGITLREGEARLDALPDGSARIAGRVRAGDGVLTVDGSLGWQGASTPLQLRIRGNDALVADTRDLRAIVDPDVLVRVAAGEPVTVTGTVTVPSADIALERLDRGVTTSPDVVVLDPIDPKAKLETPVALDLAIMLGDDVSLSGFGLTGTLDGRLQVRARPGREMTAHGQLDVDGRYIAYGQRLDITRGRLNWAGGAVADPVLDIRAEREVGDITAGVDVRGRASAPRASVWTSTGASQSEALAYLALGRSLSSASGDESRQLNAASAALSAGGSLLASQLGARIGLDEAGVLESRALGGSVLGIGKYLSPRLYIGYGVSLLGTGQVLTLKYLLRNGFDIEIESSTVENRASINYRREK